MTFKKLTIGILSTLCALSALTAIGCKDKDDDKKPVVPPTYSYACTDEEKGHEFSEKTGKCIRCDKEPDIPLIPAKQRFEEVVPCEHGSPCPDCDYQGTGVPYDRIELTEGYFTLTITKDLACTHGEDCNVKECGAWFAFSVEQAGQYVLHTVDGANGCTIKRHAMESAGVITEGVPAISLYDDDDDLYSFVNCGTKYYSAHWRATYCIKAPEGTAVQVRFVRIDEPAWEPEAFTTKVYATQINDKKAEDFPSTMALTEVPYDAKYELKSDGYYHVVDENGADKGIIYAAINANASRLFSDTSRSFTNVMMNANSALHISDGTDDKGNYKILDYTPFIVNWKNEDDSWTKPQQGVENKPAADLNKNCYQNYCNKDGVYPVNKELYDFLTRYTQKDRPDDTAITDQNWADKVDWLWLSACYTYEEVPVGEQKNPLVLTVGENEVSVKRFKQLYAILKEKGRYILTCDNAALKITVNGQQTTFETPVFVDGEKAFSLSSGSVNMDCTITVVKVADDRRETLTQGENEHTIGAGATLVLTFISTTDDQYLLDWEEQTGVAVYINENTTESASSPVEFSESTFTITVVNNTFESVQINLELYTLLT